MSRRIVAGVMSGTSADGINVALVRTGDAHTGLGHHNFELLGHAEYAYPPKVRAAILAAMNADRARVADLARLSFLLGELYADAVRATQKRFRVRAELVGCHGQTLYHQGERQPFLGNKIAATWQTGEAAVIAARLRVPVVSDFRPADMAAGGKGAPLVSYLDYLFFRDAKFGRIVQNIGGIANLTAIPARASLEEIVAFDTGPGNMVIDAVTEALFGRRFDRSGRIAASGKVIEPVLHGILAREFFRRRPPKTAGREEFGRDFVRDFLQKCRRAAKQDVVATATDLTARSIADAVGRFVVGEITARKSRARKPSASSTASPNHSFREIIISGGGAKNRTLLASLTQALAPIGITVRLTDELGLPSEAKEAVAFAMLAFETWNRRPSNVPSATGAKRPAILGKVSYA